MSQPDQYPFSLTEIISGSCNSINTQSGPLAFGSIATSNTFNIMPNRELVSSTFIQKESGNVIEMIYREVCPYGITYTSTFTSYPATGMVKEIYGILEGKLQLLGTIRGTETPGYYVDPAIEWEE